MMSIVALFCAVFILLGDTKQSPPFCRDEASLDQAITMNGTHLRGRPLRVSYGQAKKPKVSAFQAAALQLAEGLGD